MSARCPKCGASRANLEARAEYIEGADLMTVRCRLCSWRRSEPVVQEMKREVTKDDPRPGRRPKKAINLVPCEIEGCPLEIVRDSNVTGLCQPHRESLERWKRTRMTTPPPLIRPEGRWIENPAKKEASK